MKARRFVIETRRSSTRTPSGFTKWEKWGTYETLEAAGSGGRSLEQWSKEWTGNWRVVDREARDG
jgi:hypothetical protein